MCNAAIITKKRMTQKWTTKNATINQTERNTKLFAVIPVSMRLRHYMPAMCTASEKQMDYKHPTRCELDIYTRT